MNINKHMDFFNPLELSDEIHIIGVGAIGSHIAEMCARLGLSNIILYDFDTVSEHNVANQIYNAKEADDRVLKTDAIEATCKAINPLINIRSVKRGWFSGVRLSGYVFLCADKMEVRNGVAKENVDNPRIKAMFDFRMGLEDAQHYAANWRIERHKEALIGSMDFTDEETKGNVPVSACGTTLAILPTIRMITAAGMSNFINFVKDGELKRIILINAFRFEIDTFK